MNSTAPLRRTVGRAPKGNLLDQLDQLNASLRELTNSHFPHPMPGAFANLLAKLHDADVRYLVVGGVAV